MKYETIKAGSLIEYGDEAYNEYKDEWSRIDNSRIGLPCMTIARRPVAETFAPNNLANVKEGDRVGPFSHVVDTEDVRRKLYHCFKECHIEYAKAGVYLVVNHTYKEVV